MENTTIICGLCAGRHPIEDVEEYIFPNTVENIFDSDELEEQFFQFYLAHGGAFAFVTGTAVNQHSYDDVVLKKGTKAVRLYVTGLTPVLTAVIRCCYSNGIELELMHYDRDTNSYRSQMFKF